MSLIRTDPRAKGVTYVRATCLPSDELEPCLRNGMGTSIISAHGHYPVKSTNGNIQKTRFRDQRPKKNDCMGKCVLCLLIHAVFIFGIFLVFLVGHWVSEVEFGNDTSLLAAINHLNPNFTLTQLNLTTNTSPASPTAKEILEKMTKVQVQNITMMEVYPPRKGTEHKLGFVHRGPKKELDEVISLPSYLKPIHYELRLDFTEFSTAEHIRGNVTVLIECKANYTQKDIIFHAAPNIFIKRLKLEHNHRNLKLGEVKREFNKDIVKVAVDEPLKEAWYHLKIEFRTRICQSNSGGVHCIRRSIYRNNSTTTHKVVGFATKFELSFARTFLPCWDEPKLKTTFNVTTRSEADLTVLFNTAPQDELDEVGLKKAKNKIVKFKETPQLSIYLLAFALTDYTPLELRTQRNLPLVIWSDPLKMAAVHFTASFSPTIFDRIEKDLEVLYPLPKLDLMLTPNYPVGGMENWGLIVFQEDAALLSSSILDEQNMTVDKLAEQYKIEKIVTHEMVHQWLGNLVTMSDWSDLWLVEGFTTYFAFDYLNLDHPYLTDNEYYMQLTELIQVQTSTSPSRLIQPIKNHQAINKIFDEVNLYTKGSVIAKMIKDLVGVDGFRQGITKFLKDNAYKSVGREALWEALPAFADHGVEDERLSDVLEGWLENKGIPEVIVSRNYDDQTIRISQRTADQNNYIIYLDDTHAVKETKKKNKREAVTPSPQVASTFNDSYFQVHPNTFTMKPRRKKNHRQNRQKNIEKDKISVFGNTKLNKKSQSRPTELEKQLSVKREQRRRKVQNNGDSQQQWSIPFSYSFGSLRSNSGQTVRQFWLHNDTIRFVDLGVQPYQYILVNPHWIYPYKVNYDLDNWKLLINQLYRDHTGIPVMSRMQLLIDADTYLKQSGVPHTFVRLLGYLMKEEDLGVLLVGLDLLHGLVDMFSGTNVVGPLLVHLNGVIQQLDDQLLKTASNPELASVWLLSPQRLSKLYQLRCVANQASCDQNKQMTQWMSHPTALDPAHHQQITAICHYLFTQAGPSELSMLMGLLKLRSGQWSVNIQLATCVRDDMLIGSVVDKIIKTKNAAVYLSVLQGSYTVQYNKKFRQLFWIGVGHLSLHERQLLFAVNTGKSDEIGRYLLHSARTLPELEMIESLLPDWPQNLRMHLDYLKRKMKWTQNIAADQIHQYLVEDVE